MEGTLKKYKNFYSGYKNCYLKLVLEGPSAASDNKKPPYLMIEKTYYASTRKDREQIVQLRKGSTAVEATGKDDFMMTYSQAGAAAKVKKVYFKAKDQKERD
jgi:hypothetical protein